VGCVELDACRDGLVNGDGNNHGGERNNRSVFRCVKHKMKTLASGLVLGSLGWFQVNRVGSQNGQVVLDCCGLRDEDQNTLVELGSVNDSRSEDIEVLPMDAENG
jgi:hypothetical protein